MKLGYIFLIPLPNPQQVYRNTLIRRQIRQTKSAGKVMMIIFFDHKGVIYQHTVPSKTAVNGAYYVSVLKFLRQHISRKRRELVGNWTFHHDNALPHVATSVQQYLSKCNIKIMPNPPSRYHTMQFLAISDVEGEAP